MHGLFLVGLAYLIGIALIQALLLLNEFLPKTGINDGNDQKKTSIDKAQELLLRSSVAVFLALAGTFNTPWTYRLLPYVLSLLNSPVTSMNKENGAIKLQELSSPSFYPFVFLFVMFAFHLIQKARMQAQNKFKGLMPATMLGLTSLITACAFRRLTPLALIVLAAAFARLYYDTKNNLRPENSIAVPLENNDTISADKKDAVLTDACSFAAAMIACGLSSIFLVQPSIPSASRLFTPPTKAIEFIAKNPPAGKLLNDSKYGSMMTWTLAKPPDIFIDGRFDSYERQLVYDYLNMRFCRGDWQALLRKYNIAWLFLPSDAPAVIKLKDQHDWKTVYEDSAASILIRNDSKNANEKLFSDLPEGIFGMGFLGTRRQTYHLY